MISRMKDTSCRDDWRSLSEQASKESDPQKLLELITRINRLLEESHQRSQTDEVSAQVDTVLLATSRTSQYDFDLYSFPGECAAATEYGC